MTARFITVRLALATVLTTVAYGEVVDRIAVIINKRVVKHSDIDQDVRATAFLNRASVTVTPAARKESAQRLIDQMLIREELERSDYETAPIGDAQNMLADLKKSRFVNEMAFRKELGAYGITEDDLKERLFFQMTVLRFIDQRFKPSVVVSDDEIKSYFERHRQELQKEHPDSPATLEALHDIIHETITGDRVNKLLFDWLERRRKTTKIIYREEGLQ